ncbi:MAG: ABC transporter ATP-binding protein [SAR116 cluster bacterium]|nr:ABC transporter ATP-binding protein [SAR116 cluster bacterium]
MNCLIEFKNINKSFDGKIVLNGINLKVIKGKSLVLIGQSGSGKSVLLKCLLGIIQPNKGQVIINDNSFFDQDLYLKEKILKRFGVAFQGNALFDSLKIWENISFKLIQTQRLSNKEIKDKVEHSMDLVGLSKSIMHQYPSQISGGMQKRVAIARAIIDEPEILIFDEPTAGLDPVTGGKINNLIIDNVKRLGCTSLTITHDMDSVRKIADNVAMISRGKITWNGKKSEIEKSSNKELNEFINII